MLTTFTRFNIFYAQESKKKKTPKNSQHVITNFATYLSTKQGMLKIVTVKLQRPKALELLTMYVSFFHVITVIKN